MERTGRRFTILAALAAALALTPLAGSAHGGSSQRGGGHGPRGPRVETVRLIGAVTDLAADGLSFALEGRSGRTVAVTLADDTAITSGETGDPITLANDQIVTVRGTYDRATDTIAATEVTLYDYTALENSQARGTVASVDADAGSFVLTVQSVECGGNIVPTGDAITVVTDADTVFKLGRRQTGSFADVAENGVVEVKGTFNTVTQTLTAEVVSLR